MEVATETNSVVVTAVAETNVAGVTEVNFVGVAEVCGVGWPTGCSAGSSEAKRKAIPPGSGHNSWIHRQAGTERHWSL